MTRWSSWCTERGRAERGINPDDADKLAAPYTVVIPVDQTLLADISQAVHRSSSQVASNLRVIDEQSTSILEIAWRLEPADGRDRRARGGVAAQRNQPGGGWDGALLAADRLASEHRRPGRDHPQWTHDRDRRGARTDLGIVLLVAWERSDPHVTDARSLSGQFGTRPPRPTACHPMPPTRCSSGGPR